MISIIIALISLSTIFSTGLRSKKYYEQNFLNFMKTKNIIYSSNEEYSYRLQIFSNNMDKIYLHNNSPSSYKLGLTIFSTLTKEEFVSIYSSGFKYVKVEDKDREISKKVNLPDELDWSKEGAVSEIKDQGHCGSCWAFSTTGSIESLNYIKNKEMILLSEQQLVDCSTSYGNQGCNGGQMTYGFQYAKSNGLCLEDDYPYHALDEKCKTVCKIYLKIKNYKTILMSEVELANNLVNNPISVAINAEGLQLYTSGIYTDFCLPTLNHGVLLVGYGTDNGVKYWKIKNSWGLNWGENGYFRIEKDILSPFGQCGVAMSASYPELE